MISLTVQELSCWQTDIRTHKRTLLKTIAPSLRHAAWLVVESIDVSYCPYRQCSLTWKHHGTLSVSERQLMAGVCLWGAACLALLDRWLKLTVIDDCFCLSGLLFLSSAYSRPDTAQKLNVCRIYLLYCLFYARRESVPCHSWYPSPSFYASTPRSEAGVRMLVLLCCPSARLHVCVPKHS